jgi:hypothetical protein
MLGMVGGGIMGGSTSKVGSVSDVKFTDPSGQYGAGMNYMLGQYGSNLGMADQAVNKAYGIAGAYDPNAYMTQFLGQAPGLANLVSGPNSALEQELNAIASREAKLGSEAALASIPGAANSGAGLNAFGTAYATPFANVNAQLGQNQLEGTLGLWNNALGLNAQNQNAATQYGLNAASLGAGTYGGLASSALGNYGQLAAGTGGLWQPTYQKNPGFLDYASGLGTAALGLGSLGFKPFG